jgi:hypothetical protein
LLDSPFNFNTVTLLRKLYICGNYFDDSYFIYKFYCLLWNLFLGSFFWYLVYQNLLTLINSCHFPRSVNFKVLFMNINKGIQYLAWEVYLKVWLVFRPVLVTLPLTRSFRTDFTFSDLGEWVSSTCQLLLCAWHSYHWVTASTLAAEPSPIKNIYFAKISESTTG